MSAPVVVVPGASPGEIVAVVGYDGQGVIVSTPTSPVSAPNALVYQVSAVPSWTVAHPFPYQPAVRLINADEESVDIEIEYPAADRVYIEFPSPFTGTIILS